jgi:hypothetical protein
VQVVVPADLPHLLFVGDVGAHGAGFVTRGTDTLRHLLGELCALLVVNDYARAFASQAPRYRGSDTPAGAGHYRYLPPQLSHVPLLPGLASLRGV